MFEHDKIFEKWHENYVGYNDVIMPPGWKNKEQTNYKFVFVDCELTASEYVDFFEFVVKNNISNAKLFTPRTLQYASVLHPAFYNAVIQNNKNDSIIFQSFLTSRQPILYSLNSEIGLNDFSIRLWLQSVVFLAGVTLSAALIQNRWSVGTLESKLNRLWQVASYGERKGFEKLGALKIQEFVLNASIQLNNDPIQLLVDLKKYYSKVLEILMEYVEVEKRQMHETQLNDIQKFKYGFIKDLRFELGSNLQSVLLYGSAVNSEKFADYDLIIVVKNLEDALLALKGKSPTYNGLELNISVFNESDFWTYQLASGDNLFDHALCLFGSVTVPHKKANDLIIRNFSFGYVRFLQLMGMSAKVGNISSEVDDKKNLIDYFIKIPLNVYKGIQGCYGKVGTNEEINNWSKSSLSFNVKEYQALARNNNAIKSLANATWATQEVMHYFDLQKHIFNLQESDRIPFEEKMKKNKDKYESLNY
ncbi:MAG: hypothetical protein IPG55_06775 [Saprospiraceae bacterium]|nr:hypothetical protein [Candidatus Defluviibacterium haderslevense]